jgi:hypothetical protein
MTLTAGERPVSDVPIRLSLANESAGRVSTDANGTATARLQIGAAIPAGNATLEYGLPDENGAITASTVSARVRILPTDTELSLSAAAVGGNATVNGRLTTTDGRPVSDAAIMLSANGSRLTQVRTDGSGRYRTDVVLPINRSDGNATVQLTATFRGAGSNLRSAQQRTLLTITTDVASSGAGSEGSGLNPNQNPSERNQSADLPVWLLGVGGVFIVGVIGVVYRARRETQSQEPEGEETDSPPTPSDSEPEFVDRQLRRATDLTDGGEYRDAVTTAYETFRQSLGEPAPSRTHREFYDYIRSTESLDEEAESHLRSLTDYYEKAVYAPAKTVETDARAAIDAVRALVTDETPESEPAD